MTSKERKWGVSILVLVLLGYILPYTVFTDVAEWYGSFFIWIVLGVLVIIVNYFFTKNWGE